MRQQSPCVVVFESCSGSNYWAQYCFSMGHKDKLISTRLCGAIRQKKTDENDALAIVQAALLPEVHKTPINEAACLLLI